MAGLVPDELFELGLSERFAYDVLPDVPEELLRTPRVCILQQRAEFGRDLFTPARVRFNGSEVHIKVLYDKGVYPLSAWERWHEEKGERPAYLLLAGTLGHEHDRITHTLIIPAVPYHHYIPDLLESHETRDFDVTAAFYNDRLNNLGRWIIHEIDPADDEKLKWAIISKGWDDNRTHNQRSTFDTSDRERAYNNLDIEERAYADALKRHERPEPLIVRDWQSNWDVAARYKRIEEAVGPRIWKRAQEDENVHEETMRCTVQSYSGPYKPVARLTGAYINFLLIMMGFLASTLGAAIGKELVTATYYKVQALNHVTRKRIEIHLSGCASHPVRCHDSIGKEVALYNSPELTKSLFKVEPIAFPPSPPPETPAPPPPFWSVVKADVVEMNSTCRMSQRIEDWLIGAYDISGGNNASLSANVARRFTTLLCTDTIADTPPYQEVEKIKTPDPLCCVTQNVYDLDAYCMHRPGRCPEWYVPGQTSKDHPDVMKYDGIEDGKCYDSVCLRSWLWKMWKTPNPYETYFSRFKVWVSSFLYLFSGSVEQVRFLCELAWPQVVMMSSALGGHYPAVAVVTSIITALTYFVLVQIAEALGEIREVVTRALSLTLIAVEFPMRAKRVWSFLHGITALSLAAWVFCEYNELFTLQPIVGVPFTLFSSLPWNSGLFAGLYCTLFVLFPLLGGENGYFATVTDKNGTPRLVWRLSKKGQFKYVGGRPYDDIKLHGFVSSDNTIECNPATFPTSVVMIAEKCFHNGKPVLVRRAHAVAVVGKDRHGNRLECLLTARHIFEPDPAVSNKSPPLDLNGSYVLVTVTKGGHFRFVETDFNNWEAFTTGSGCKKRPGLHGLNKFSATWHDQLVLVARPTCVRNGKTRNHNPFTDLGVRGVSQSSIGTNKDLHRVIYFLELDVDSKGDQYVKCMRTKGHKYKDPVAARDTGVQYYDCCTASGVSGAPVFDEASKLAGIHLAHAGFVPSIGKDLNMGSTSTMTAYFVSLLSCVQRDTGVPEAKIDFDRVNLRKDVEEFSFEPKVESGEPDNEDTTDDAFQNSVLRKAGFLSRDEARALAQEERMERETEEQYNRRIEREKERRQIELQEKEKYRQMVLERQASGTNWADWESEDSYEEQEKWMQDVTGQAWAASRKKHNASSAARGFGPKTAKPQKTIISPWLQGSGDSFVQWIISTAIIGSFVDPVEKPLLPTHPTWDSYVPPGRNKPRRVSKKWEGYLPTHYPFHKGTEAMKNQRFWDTDYFDGIEPIPEKKGHYAAKIRSPEEIQPAPRADPTGRIGLDVVLDKMLNEGVASVSERCAQWTLKEALEDHKDLFKELIAHRDAGFIEMKDFCVDDDASVMRDRNGDVMFARIGTCASMNSAPRDEVRIDDQKFINACMSRNIPGFETGTSPFVSPAASGKHLKATLREQSTKMGHATWDKVYEVKPDHEAKYQTGDLPKYDAALLTDLNAAKRIVKATMDRDKSSGFSAYYKPGSKAAYLDDAASFDLLHRMACLRIMLMQIVGAATIGRMSPWELTHYCLNDPKVLFSKDELLSRAKASKGLSRTIWPQSILHNYVLDLLHRDANKSIIKGYQSGKCSSVLVGNSHTDAGLRQIHETVKKVANDPILGVGAIETKDCSAYDFSIVRDAQMTACTLQVGCVNPVPVRNDGTQNVPAYDGNLDYRDGETYDPRVMAALGLETWWVNLMQCAVLMEGAHLVIVGTELWTCFKAGVTGSGSTDTTTLNTLIQTVSHWLAGAIRASAAGDDSVCRVYEEYLESVYLALGHQIKSGSQSRSTVAGPYSLNSHTFTEVTGEDGKVRLHVRFDNAVKLLVKARMHIKCQEDVSGNNVDRLRAFRYVLRNNTDEEINWNTFVGIFAELGIDISDSSGTDLSPIFDQELVDCFVSDEDYIPVEFVFENEPEPQVNAPVAQAAPSPEKCEQPVEQASPPPLELNPTNVESVTGQSHVDARIEMLELKVARLEEGAERNDEVKEAYTRSAINMDRLEEKFRELEHHMRHAIAATRPEVFLEHISDLRKEAKEYADGVVIKQLKIAEDAVLCSYSVKFERQKSELLDRFDAFKLRMQRETEVHDIKLQKLSDMVESVVDAVDRAPRLEVAPIPREFKRASLKPAEKKDDSADKKEDKKEKKDKEPGDQKKPLKTACKFWFANYNGQAGAKCAKGEKCGFSHDPVRILKRDKPCSDAEACLLGNYCSFQHSKASSSKD